jgi:hypothetical protein
MFYVVRYGHVPTLKTMVNISLLLPEEYINYIL